MKKNKKGRKVLLGEEIDEKLQLYLTALQNNGGGVSAHLAMTAAKGFILALNWGALAQYGGHVNITRHWAYSLFQRMKFFTEKSYHLSKQIHYNWLCWKEATVPRCNCREYWNWRHVYRVNNELGPHWHQNCSILYLDHGQRRCKPHWDNWFKKISAT